MSPAHDGLRPADLQPVRARAYFGVAVALLVVHAAYALVQWHNPAGSPVLPAQVQLRIDPNRATAAELDLLPRIGPKISAAIIAYRAAAERQPAFRTAADLDRVPRIGPATVALLRPFLCFPNTDDRTDDESDAP